MYKQYRRLARRAPFHMDEAEDYPPVPKFRKVRVGFDVCVICDCTFAQPEPTGACTCPTCTNRIRTLRELEMQVQLARSAVGMIQEILAEKKIPLDSDALSIICQLLQG